MAISLGIPIVGYDIVVAFIFWKEAPDQWIDGIFYSALSLCGVTNIPTLF